MNFIVINTLRRRYYSIRILKKMFEFPPPHPTVLLLVPKIVFYMLKISFIFYQKVKGAWENPVCKKRFHSISFTRRLSISLKATTFQIKSITVTNKFTIGYLNSCTMHKILSKRERNIESGTGKIAIKSQSCEQSTTFIHRYMKHAFRINSKSVQFFRWL